MRRDPQRCFGTDNEPLGQYQGLRNNHSEHPPVFSRAAQLVYMEHTGKPSGRLSALFIFIKQVYGVFWQQLSTQCLSKE